MNREDGMLHLFKILTGAPTSSYSLTKDFRSYLILIDAALKKKHIVTLEAIPEAYEETARVKNLNNFQAYRVLDIKKSGLKIRNLAEPDLVTKLAFEECLIFARLVIYRVESSYRFISQKLRHRRRYFSKVKLTVPVRTKCYF